MQRIWISSFGFRAGQLGPDDLVIIPKLVWILVMAGVMRGNYNYGIMQNSDQVTNQGP